MNLSLSKNYSRTSLLILLFAILISFPGILNAQVKVQKKVEGINSEQLVTNLESPTFFLPRVIESVAEPISFFGKAKPGATVTLIITPFSTGGSNKRVLVAGGAPNPYEMQTHTAIANENGGWTIKNVQIKFREGAKNRRIEILLGQKLGQNASKLAATNYNLRDDASLMITKKAVVKNSILTITLESISNNENQGAVKLGISQYTDVFGNNASLRNRTNESNEIVCWWENVCQQPRLFKGSTSVGNSRSYVITPQALSNTQNPAMIDIWTKYIGFYPISKADLSAKNIVAPHTLFFKKTESKLDEKGFQHDKILVKEVQENGGIMYKDVRVNFNNKTITMRYKITLVSE